MPDLGLLQIQFALDLFYVFRFRYCLHYFLWDLGRISPSPLKVKRVRVYGRTCENHLKAPSNNATKLTGTIASKPPFLPLRLLLYLLFPLA